MGVSRSRVKKYLRNAQQTYKYAKVAHGVYKKWAKQQKKSRKSSKSKTKTKTSANPLVNKPIMAPDNGLSFSACKIKYPAMKGYMAVKRNTNQDVWSSTHRFYKTSPIGQQAAFSLYDHLNSTISANKPGLLTDNHFERLMEDCVRTTTAQQDYYGITLHDDPLLWLDYMEVETIFTNQSPGLVILTLFDCVCRDAKAIDPYNDWNSGIQQAEGSGTLNDPTDPTIYGGLPYEAKLFNSRWRIKKTTMIELPTGRSHRHIMRFDYHGRLPMTEVRSSEGQTYKGITQNLLAVIRGIPVDNTNAYAPVAGSEVSTDQVKVIGVSTNRCYTRLSSAKQKKVYREQGLPLTGGMGAAYIQSENAQQVVNSYTVGNWG